MNKEEKEAIEELKKDSEILKLELIGFTIKSRNKLANNIEIAVNYIDKLQKENKELKEEIESWKFTHKYVEENYVSKDKIRTKIKELEKEMNREDIQEEHFWCVEAERSVLEELLGE